VPLAAAALRAGLEGSLKRLATDHIEVFALHDPDPEMLVTEELHRALEDVVRSGKARAVGIAGSVEAAAAALRAGLSIGHIQVPDPPFAAAAAQLVQTAGPQASYFLATHSIYGRADPVRVAVDRAGSRERLGLVLASHGYAMPLDRAVRTALVDRALAANPDGVVLLSMFSTLHLHANLARLGQRSHRAVALFEELGSVRRADDAVTQCAPHQHPL
jgi:aryl-alcohol dehydrogenase-like predicted oxidoreductase